METSVIVAIIGACGLVLAAAVPIILKGWGGSGGKPTPPGGSNTETPVVQTDHEVAVRANSTVVRLLTHKGWKDAAEAAIQFFCRGIEPRVQGNKQTGTWDQVRAVHEELTNLAQQQVPRMWPELLEALNRCLHAGEVTTYGNCSEWSRGHRRAAPSIVAMLNAIASRGNHAVTNRVVGDDGGLNAPAEYGQRALLEAENVPINDLGKVDFTLIGPTDIV